MENVLVLVVLFICHWLADYTHLSTSWMLSAKRLGKPLFPIFVHASVHGGLMFIALNVVGVDLYLSSQLCVAQVLAHFVIDAWKGKMNVWFPELQSPANKWHWVVFGFDQLLHSLFIVAMYNSTL